MASDGSLNCSNSNLDDDGSTVRTSLLALIEKRFLNSSGTPLHLTKRDASANDLESMFDLTHSPSLSTAVGQAQPPMNDCTPQ